MKKKHSLFFIFSFFLSVITIYPNVSYAYLDMGTGSYILQIILGGILGGIFWIKIYWMKFKSFFVRLFSRKNNNEKTNS